MTLIVGRKDIMNALNIASWRTVRRWKKFYSLPIRHLPSGKPHLIPEELKSWLIHFDEIEKSKEK